MILRTLFFLFIIRPISTFVLGMNVRNYIRLPKKGPVIVIANHNSHLDTVVLMSLFPLKSLSKIHPVAAADYFLANPILAWFSTKIIGIIPFKRTVGRENPFAEIEKALDQNEIIIFFPEGSRGEAEKLSPMKSGIAHLAKKFPHVPIIPVFLHGLGKALPKGDPILVPFMVDVAIGEPIPFSQDKASFMESIAQAFEELSHFDKVGNVKDEPKGSENGNFQAQG